MPKSTPKPVLNRRLLLPSVLLFTLCAGLVIGMAVPSGAVIALVVILGLVAAGLFADAWWIWYGECKVWARRFGRAKRVGQGLGNKGGVTK